MRGRRVPWLDLDSDKGYVLVSNGGGRKEVFFLRKSNLMAAKRAHPEDVCHLRVSYSLVLPVPSQVP